MKKVLVIAAMIAAAACSNPEDKATGNADSISFNQNENTNLNTQPGPTDPNSQTDVEKPDTSAAPALDKQNSNSSTKGTNRSYGGRDSAK